MDLIFYAKVAEYDYFAFCDQDDVWYKEKIDEMVKKIDEVGRKPALVYSAIDIVDSTLKKIGEYCADEQLVNSMEYCLYSLGDIQGCSMLINRELMFFLQRKIPKTITMHDEYTHKVCLSIGGNIVCIKKPLSAYRQHEENAVGFGNSSKGHRDIMVKRILRRCVGLTKHKKGYGVHALMLQEILEIYDGFIDEKNATLIRQFAYYNENMTSYVRQLLRKKRTEIPQNILDKYIWFVEGGEY